MLKKYLLHFKHAFSVSFGVFCLILLESFCSVLIGVLGGGIYSFGLVFLMQENPEGNSFHHHPGQVHLVHHIRDRQEKVVYDDLIND